MARGAAQLTSQLYAEGEFDGVMGLGGAGGTEIVSTAMQTLPLGLPEANEALFDALRQNLRPLVELIELDMHINDPEFATAMADRLLKMLRAQTM